ncbi:MAG: TerB family tellurite resistance protein [Sphingobacteriales bacterium]|nr:MAG: TerB family tellurite resistance protein [Sphingobacteriales bacterium]
MRFCIGICLCSLLSPMQAGAQADEIAQLVLNYEKLAQLRKILKNMYDGYTILTKGYNTVKGISEGSFNLHDAFLQGLLQVSPAVRNYVRVKDIIRDQAHIVREYKEALSRFRQDPNFQQPEIDYMDKVYRNLFRQSMENLDALAMVVTASKLRMSDGERLEQIDRIADDTSAKLSFLRRFNAQALLLQHQRGQQLRQINTEKQLYGLKK